MVNVVIFFKLVLNIYYTGYIYIRYTHIHTAVLLIVGKKCDVYDDIEVFVRKFANIWYWILKNLTST